MAITFAVRGDNMVPRYNNGFPEFGLRGATKPEVAVDGTAIGGSSIDCDTGFVGNIGIHYQGIGNWPTTPTCSVLVRIKTASLTGGLGLFNSGGSCRQNAGQLSAYINGSDFRVYMRNRNGSLGINNGTISSHGMSLNTWHDLVFTFTGDTTASGFNAYVDGSLVGSLTSTRFWDNPREPVYQGLSVCLSENVQNGQFNLNEFVVWDEIIDPTSVGLTSGSGSLNGASRSAFVDVARYDAAASIDRGGFIGTGNFGA